MADVTPDDVLLFWLGPPGSEPQLKRWFSRDDALDAEIRTRFGASIEAAARGGLADWKSTPRGRLALVILCDQYSRNAFRGTPRAFAQDALALEVAKSAHEHGDDGVLGPIEASFLLMPYLHAEDRPTQQRALDGFVALAARATSPADAKYLAAGVSSAKQHAAIVERFGRYPHRNAILGRASTAEEEEFLKQPGSSF